MSDETKAEIQWSPQQLAVFSEIESPELSQHLVVQALAGTGKTTTSVESMFRIPEDLNVLALAFNRTIANTLKARVPDGVRAQTFHGLGLSAITRSQGRREIDGQTDSRLALEIVGRGKELAPLRTAVRDLVSKAKNTTPGFPDPARLDFLLDAYMIEVPRDVGRPKVIELATRILRLSLEAPASAPLGFDDMIWLPCVLGLPFYANAYVFADEAQDLNACQLHMVREACNPAGRIVLVGDPNQAIYGWRGAEQGAIGRMRRELDAEVLPLTVTYRCPKAIVREACTLVPDFEAHESAPDGRVFTGKGVGDLLSCVAVGDLVLSRTNAPIVSLCFYLLSHGRRASILGRDLGAGLSAWVRNSHAPDVATLTRAITAWEDAEIKRLEEEDRDTEPTRDKTACLRVLARGAASVTEVLSRIDRLFARASGQDEDGIPKDAVVLSTVHRAKGLEADRVWLLRDTFRVDEDASGTQEERNLLYVGITRAMRELVYVHGERDEGGRPEYHWR
jgi:DNA helicase-2/ATP-dependent DNA helicase PcrA